MMMMILGMNFDLVSLRTNQSDEALEKEHLLS
jgi:hypothetical protein